MLVQAEEAGATKEGEAHKAGEAHAAGGHSKVYCTAYNGGKGEEGCPYLNWERWGLAVLWAMADLSLIAIPTEIFSEFMKETYGFITGNALGPYYVVMDEDSMAGANAVADI